MSELTKVRASIIDKDTGAKIEDVDVLTSGDSVILDDGSTFQEKVNNGDFVGPKGDAATIRVGLVNTVAPEENASVTNTGNTHSAVFSFNIPRGKDGLSLNILGYYDTEEELFAAHPDGSEISGGYIVQKMYYFWDGEANEWAHTAELVGPKGEKGEDGLSVSIMGEFATLEELTTLYPNGASIGAIVGGVYYYWDSIHDEWTSLGELYGFVPDIKIGEVTEGETPSVTNSGTRYNPILDFVLRRGEQGIQGLKGDTGKAATVKVGTVTAGDTPAVTNSGNVNDAILNFVLQRGPQGPEAPLDDIYKESTITNIDSFLLNNGRGSITLANNTVFIVTNPLKFGVVVYLPTDTSDFISSAVIFNSGTSKMYLSSNISSEPLPTLLENTDYVLGVAIICGTKYVTLSTLELEEDESSSEIVDFTLAKGDQGIQGIQGIQGPRGLTGTAATISIGNVTVGGTAAVTNSGTSNAAVLNFNLPTPSVIVKDSDEVVSSAGAIITQDTTDANKLNISCLGGTKYFATKLEYVQGAENLQYKSIIRDLTGTTINVTLENGIIYRNKVAPVTSLTITVPPLIDDFDEVSFLFYSGTGIVASISSNLECDGTHCTDGVFVPEAGYRYAIAIYNNGFDYSCDIFGDPYTEIPT